LVAQQIYPSSQALREKTNEEKGEAKSIPPGFTSPTLILPTVAVETLGNMDETQQGGRGPDVGLTKMDDATTGAEDSKEGPNDSVGV
jgi:hypothetical protein